jgi:hypothetical protein
MILEVVEEARTETEVPGPNPCCGAIWGGSSQ